MDIKRNKLWILDKKGAEIREIEDKDKFSDKWGSQGFTVWIAPDWAKSGRTTWLNFHVREGGNWHKASWQGGRELKEKVLECFYKHYDPNTETFKYWKRYYNLGEDFWQNTNKGIVLVEFVEEFRVEKNRESGNWLLINKGNKNSNPWAEKETLEKLNKKK